ncbi:hypothetical protein ACQZ4Q_21590 [Agrobacterium vitis]|uniref:hypothetical protein n=1 Tax=Agrobacterium vitis TaxID=373 RepID=UPI003D26950B
MTVSIRTSIFPCPLVIVASDNLCAGCIRIDPEQQRWRRHRQSDAGLLPTGISSMRLIGYRLRVKAFWHAVKNVANRSSYVVIVELGETHFVKPVKTGKEG